MQKSIFIFIVLFSAFLANAQEDVVIQIIKGRVVDEANNPVAFTNIGLEGTYYGTASDSKGDFELKISAGMSTRRIYFSAVGFKNRTFPVTELFNKDFNLIKLESQSYDIGDVDINAQSMVLYRILRTASDNVSRNFIAGPFNLNCRYESEKTVDEKNYTIKSNVRIYDRSGYTTPSIENAFKGRTYSFSNVEKNLKSYLLSDGLTNMDEMLELDLARSVAGLLNPVLVDRFVLSQEEDAEINGIDVWVIGFNLANPGLEGSGDFYASRFEGKIYIDKNNYEIRKIEGWVKSPKQNRSGRGLAIGPENNNFLENVAYDFNVNYNTNGLEFISLHKTYRKEGQQVNETSRLVVNNISTATVVPVDSREYFIGE
ncbi:MAG: carboxypeptidase-like regulatory domain-containing protein [Prolixibacteraceae bacterium]|nr:carboxypeptidase-like regulatory domain-containing protein [Prolixibacteraceae bacterium]